MKKQNDTPMKIRKPKKWSSESEEDSKFKSRSVKGYKRKEGKRVEY